MVKKIITLENVSFAYGENGTQLNHISLEIKKGECVLITGASGCGKTTLTRLINGLIPHYYEGQVTGEVYLAGKNVKQLASWDFGQRVGSVFQDARSQFFTSTVVDELAFASENYGLAVPKMKEQLRTVLSENRLESLRNRKLDHLSSGEKQKVAMSAVQVLDPEIYVLDEPSANLDNEANQRLNKTLQALKKRGKTIVIADHRFYYLMDVVDRIIFMEKGEIQAQWSMTEFKKMSDNQLKTFGIRSSKEISLQEIRKRTSLQSANKEPAFLVLEDISVAYHRFAPPLIKQLNATVKRGEIVLLTGKNGLGKTTLARMLCGLIKERAGKISMDEVVQSAKKRRQQFWFVLQDADYQLFSDSVANELLLGLPKNAETVKRAAHLLQELGLYACKEQHPATLSGGQKQRLVFAVGLMREPKILLLDEPTSGLDAKNMYRMKKMIQEYAAKGITFLIITHDFEFAMDFSDQIIALKADQNSTNETVLG